RTGLKNDSVSELRLVKRGPQVAPGGNGQGRSRRGGIGGIECLRGGRKGGGKSDAMHQSGCCECGERACNEPRSVAGRAQIQNGHSIPSEILRWIAHAASRQQTGGNGILRAGCDVSKLSPGGYVGWSGACRRKDPDARWPRIRVPGVRDIML